MNWIELAARFSASESVQDIPLMVAILLSSITQDSRSIHIRKSRQVILLTAAHIRIMSYLPLFPAGVARIRQTLKEGAWRVASPGQVNDGDAMLCRNLCGHRFHSTLPSHAIRGPNF